MRMEIPTWILYGPMANLSSPLHLILNPSRIQIQTQFFCGSQFITVAGPTLFFSLVFSLSLSPPLLLCLSLSPLGHYRPPVRRSSPRFSLFITLGQTHTTSTTATTTPNPIFFPQISSTTHKKSQRSSKNKSGSDPSDSRLKIRFFEKYIKFQWSSKSVPNLVWWRERPVPGIREGGNTEREAH